MKWIVIVLLVVVVIWLIRVTKKQGKMLQTQAGKIKLLEKAQQDLSGENLERVKAVVIQVQDQNQIIKLLLGELGKNQVRYYREIIYMLQRITKRTFTRELIECNRREKEYQELISAYFRGTGL